MYAEERQQAIAPMIAARGRMSVRPVRAVRGDDRDRASRPARWNELRFVRRVHGGAMRRHAMTSLENGLTERDLRSTEEKDAIARRRTPQLPPTDATILIDVETTGSSRGGAPARPATGRLDTLGAHRRCGWRSTRVSSCTCSPDGPPRDASGGRHRDDRRPRAGARRPGLRRDQRRHRRVTASPRPTRRRRPPSARSSLRARVVVLADATKVGVETTVRFAAADEVDV